MLQIGYYRTFLITSEFLNYSIVNGFGYLSIHTNLKWTVILYIITFAAHYIINLCFWYWVFLIYPFLIISAATSADEWKAWRRHEPHCLWCHPYWDMMGSFSLLYCLKHPQGSLRGKRKLRPVPLYHCIWKACQVPARLQQHFVLLSMARLTDKLGVEDLKSW